MNASEQPRSREPVTAFIPSTLKQALQERARLDDRSVGAEIRIAIAALKGVKTRIPR